MRTQEADKVLCHHVAEAAERATDSRPLCGQREARHCAAAEELAATLAEAAADRRPPAAATTARQPGTAEVAFLDLLSVEPAGRLARARPTRGTSRTAAGTTAAAVNALLYGEPHRHDAGKRSRRHNH